MVSFHPSWSDSAFDQNCSCCWLLIIVYRGKYSFGLGGLNQRKSTLRHWNSSLLMSIFVQIWFVQIVPKKPLRGALVKEAGRGRNQSWKHLYHILGTSDLDESTCFINVLYKSFMYNNIRDPSLLQEVTSVRFLDDVHVLGTFWTSEHLITLFLCWLFTFIFP